LREKNLEIVSVAEDAGGVKDAGAWITAAKPTYTVLIDQSHLVTRLYGMVNVPTAVWINERGRIVRPNEVAFIDDRFKSFHGLEAAPYVAAIKDWVDNGENSPFALSETAVREQLQTRDPAGAQADAEFALAEFLYRNGRGNEAIPHFKEAQRLNPESWNYKRQAWALSDAKRDYGTSFGEEVKKLDGKPYYAPRHLLPEKKDKP